MDISKEEAVKIRDLLHNLDINESKNEEFYYDKLCEIIAGGEGFSPKVYPDSRLIPTIGYGFNMGRGKNSRKEWEEVFGQTLSFDKAIKGAIKLNKKQAIMLKKHSIYSRENELKKIYSPYWDKMRLNEKAILTDMYYQTPKLAKGNTRFARYIKEYYRTNNERFLDLATKEIQFYSSYSKNPKEKIGLQNRNDIRAIIFDSRKCPLYSKPYDKLIPQSKKISVLPEETIIPKEISMIFTETNYWDNYYIWRTLNDSKVRPAHREFEGKVFYHANNNMNHPGEDYGCRCYRQKLPINVAVIENRKEN